MATVNKSKSHNKARSASSIPVHSLPYLSGNMHSSTLLNHGLKGRSLGTCNADKSVNLSTVENEYIRNLQQQIYFLELECEYLRDQAKEIIAVPSHLTHKAERMIKKIKTMQSELQQRNKEIITNESTINILQHDKEDTVSKLQLAEETFSSEKRELISEVVNLKKQVERHKLDAMRRVADIEKCKSDTNTAMLQLNEADNKINILRSELNEKTEQFNRMRVAFEEKRAQCLKTQTEFKELEERYFHSKVLNKEKVDGGLQAELKNLRYDVREKELQAEQDRTLRLKIADDCAALVKENAALSSQVIELRKQLDSESEFNEKCSYRTRVNIQELVTLKEERRHIERELERWKEQVQIEQQKYRKLLDKFTYEEDNYTKAKLQRSKLKAELEELESIESAEAKENVDLRRDHVLLTDQVTELREKLRSKTEEVEDLQVQMQGLASNCDTLKTKLDYRSSFDQIKWEEFERMADHMKQFSRSISPIRHSVSGTPLKNKTPDVDS